MHGNRVYIMGNAHFSGTESSANDMGIRVCDDLYASLIEKKHRALDRIGKLTLAAAKAALQQSSVTFDKHEDNDVALLWGTLFGALGSIHAFDMDSLVKGPLFVNPSQFPNTVLNAPSCAAGIDIGIKGPTLSFYGRTASLDAIGIAAKMLACGQVKQALTGGADELPNQLFTQGFHLPPKESSSFLYMESGAYTDKPEICEYRTVSFSKEAGLNISYLCETIINAVDMMRNSSGYQQQSLKRVFLEAPEAKDMHLMLKAALEKELPNISVSTPEYDFMGSGSALLISQYLNESGGEYSPMDELAAFIGVGATNISLVLIKKI